MASLRFLASLFALIAIVALVARHDADADRYRHVPGPQRDQLLERAGAGFADRHA